MKKKRKHTKRKVKKLDYRKIVIFLAVILVIFIIYKILSSVTQEVSTIAEISNTIEQSNYGKVTRYIVYGTHLNIEGNIEIEESNQIENAQVIAKDISGDEIAINTEYEYSDNLLSFSTLDQINNGLNLEELDVTDYYILLKVQFSGDDIKYYSLSNDTEYGNIDYYTLTRNKKNNKIYINFGTYENIPFLGLNITKVKDLPEDVYDVVIDPGHGGSDSGAISGRYTEADIVLDCAKDLKSKLEDMGLKVLITRDGSEGDDEDTVYNIYDEDGRVTMANKSGAKIILSLHLNSNEDESTEGGVEIYACPHSDLTFAKLLATNIVNLADTSYSKMETYKEAEGVYVRTIEVDRNRTSSFTRNYTEIFDSIPYLFIIRETGGIATGAYVDGTNESYGVNEYRNSNVGLEGYLIELGYINSNKDLENILDNQDSYMEAICTSIDEFYKITGK